MTIIEACEKAAAGSMQKIRFRAIENGIAQYDVKGWHVGSNHGRWTRLDSFTASAIMAVYNALSDNAKAKMLNIPVVKLASFAYKYVK